MSLSFLLQSFPIKAIYRCKYKGIKCNVNITHLSSNGKLIQISKKMCDTMTSTTRPRISSLEMLKIYCGQSFVFPIVFKYSGIWTFSPII